MNYRMKLVSATGAMVRGSSLDFATTISEIQIDFSDACPMTGWNMKITCPTTKLTCPASDNTICFSLQILHTYVENT